MTIHSDLLNSALAFGRCIEYQDNETIHTRGDLLTGLSIVYSGQVKVGNYGLDGRYQLTAILGEGETFGEFTLFANLPRTHNAEAVNQTRVIQMNLIQYNAFIKAFPQAEKILLVGLAHKLHQTLERLDDIQRLPTHVRLAKILFNLSQQQQSLTVKLRQNQCAQLLGVTTLSAHKALKKIQQLQLIKTAYGVIHIENLDLLQAWLHQHSSILSVGPE
ncbi:Crp/Fnr family transcriptional regulator [Aliiglaciecola sp. LCG003]|uniref:Crp/Fnr family transcriptional regulator n=1 Tax=Aliiglaciecola sp. LCG003 TaxID=3053655 RepID=UPI002572D24E|nr:Crp/Fnr family transcriptional regulator [Aliiglaciecola sp. LCG003]WJG09201.1 Crp/Fnr family transcriptional regulator [Aliiglaciecola sp. LCG003]